MKILFSFLLVCGVLLGSARGDLLITEVYAAGSSNGTYSSDWFELTNNGAAAIDITGWKYDDKSNSSASAALLTGVTSIAAGQSVVFFELGASENSGVKAAAFNQHWFGTNTSSVVLGTYTGSGLGLGQGGDAVNIFNASNALVTRVFFNASTVGRTFDNAAGINGEISTLSTVGVNGAFSSFSVLPPEIGSPGSITAVPEPTSFALAGLGIAGYMAWRRRRNS
jgi:hypothetical protein